MSIRHVAIPILQEILAAARPRRRKVALVVGDGAEELERRLEVLADLAHGRQVAAPVAVVGGAPDCDDVLVLEVVLVALVDELVRSGDEGQVIDVAELVCHLVAEKPA